MRGAGYRLREDGGRLRRIPIKLRVTLVFAAVMAIVLAATGLFLYLRLESILNRTIDQDLQSRSQQLIKEMRVNNKGIGEAAYSLLDNRSEELRPDPHCEGPSLQPAHQPAAAHRPTGARRPARSPRPGAGKSP